MNDVPDSSAVFTLVNVPPEVLERYTLYPAKSLAELAVQVTVFPACAPDAATPVTCAGAVVSGGSGRVALTVADLTDSLPALSTAVTWSND